MVNGPFVVGSIYYIAMCPRSFDIKSSSEMEKDGLMCEKDTGPRECNEKNIPLNISIEFYRGDDDKGYLGTFSYHSGLNDRKHIPIPHGTDTLIIVAKEGG